ncbi:MAG: FMN-binding negative transcriptional regulator [Actinomycetales bacterium]|jgi:transcriptional regulator|nr:FMN-binding negative transcriptional regulator [Candidatus Lutibacillus vidarii]HON73728.1 FMN-binding negative transcriptional regulator [Dermatophilaceae bacterium]HRB99380.1 FMN-binding negative transcriptional regulator [Dermatophilaceae bacterium]
MYVPAHFSMTPAQIDDVLRRMTVANLVTAHEGGLQATLLPFLYRPGADGSLGALVGHVARNNRQWSEPRLGDALAIVGANDHYVSPRWRTAGDAAGSVVPTWNYVTVHAYGDLVAHDDLDWTREVVERLSAQHEDHRLHPWTSEDLLPGQLDKMMRAIVGVELRISRVEAKAKLSQNVSVPDVEGIIAGLRTDGDEVSADLLTEVSLPAAQRRAELLAGVAAGHARRTGG